MGLFTSCITQYRALAAVVAAAVAVAFAAAVVAVALSTRALLKKDNRGRVNPNTLRFGFI